MLMGGAGALGAAAAGLALSSPASAAQSANGLYYPENYATGSDDTAGIQAAANDATTYGGVLVFMPGKTYNISSTITLQCNVDGAAARINYTNTASPGIAVYCGAVVNGTNHNPIYGLVMNLPHVYCMSRPSPPSTNWDASSVGVALVNIMESTITVPWVQDFRTGLECIGNTTGFAYNTVSVGALWQNMVQFLLDAWTVTGHIGYCNQNTFTGGRLQQGDDGVHIVQPLDSNGFFSGAYMLRVGATAGASVNGNTFTGTSLEGATYSVYRLDCLGTYNQFINCRWENENGSASNLAWRSSANNNLVLRGYAAANLNVVNQAPAGSNNVIQTV